MNIKLRIYSDNRELFSREVSLPCTIGRSKQNDVTIIHPMVSRRHCEIYEKDGYVMVRDFGSLNGTFYNNQAIGSGMPLPNGAHFSIARLNFQVDAVSPENTEESSSASEELVLDASLEGNDSDDDPLILFGGCRVRPGRCRPTSARSAESLALVNQKLVVEACDACIDDAALVSAPLDVAQPLIVAPTLNVATPLNVTTSFVSAPTPVVTPIHNVATSLNVTTPLVVSSTSEVATLPKAAPSPEPVGVAAEKVPSQSLSTQFINVIKNLLGKQTEDSRDANVSSQESLDAPEDPNISDDDRGELGSHVPVQNQEDTVVESGDDELEVPEVLSTSAADSVEETIVTPTQDVTDDNVASEALEEIDDHASSVRENENDSCAFDADASLNPTLEPNVNDTAPSQTQGDTTTPTSSPDAVTTLQTNDDSPARQEEPTAQEQTQDNAGFELTHSSEAATAPVESQERLTSTVTNEQPNAAGTPSDNTSVPAFYTDPTQPVAPKEPNAPKFAPDVVQMDNVAPNDTSPEDTNVDLSIRRKDLPDVAPPTRKTFDAAVLAAAQNKTNDDSQAPAKDSASTSPESDSCNGPLFEAPVDDDDIDIDLPPPTPTNGASVIKDNSGANAASDDDDFELDGDGDDEIASPSEESESVNLAETLKPNADGVIDLNQL
ncbi:MAG: FHA domain-containing protein [Planctomycetia bacterium]|nr:FHA domain-containing protein [Planctomycetia bacterium]